MFVSACMKDADIFIGPHSLRTQYNGQNLLGFGGCGPMEEIFLLSSQAGV